MRKKLILLAFFLATFGFYVHYAAPSVTAGDSGEFMTSTLTLSIAHSPSFPVFTYLSRAFVEILPWGSAPLKINYFSCLASALGLLIFFMGLERAGVGVIGSLMLSLTLGLSSSYLANALVTEVFALNTLLVVILLFLLLEGLNGKVQPLVLFAFVLGFGMGNHQIVAFLFPAFAWVVFKNRLHLNMNFLKHAALFGMLGLSIYGAVMVRSAKEPPLNWGRPDNLSRLVRTFTRKDYGALTLALGEKPKRDVSNNLKQAVRFSKQISLEIPWALAVLGLLGFAVGIYRKDSSLQPALLMFVFTGPFFFWLGNLPFTDQSTGIMGRFFIMPVVALLWGLVPLLKVFRKSGAVLLLGALILVAPFRWSEASAVRNGFLVWDYGRAMLRIMPPGSILFMDGGDDAFYSLALLHHGLGMRPDVELHDRGGLVFKNPYGDDFRSLPKEEKSLRRQQVETAAYQRRPLYYSTMDSNVLPGIPTASAGFLKVAGTAQPGRFPWPMIILRSLYPVKPSDYRTRALAAFFPYSVGEDHLSAGNLELGLRFMRQAHFMGQGVDWLSNNLNFVYSQLAYKYLVASDYAAAEKVYLEWLEWHPEDGSAHSNLGVVYERTGRLDLAESEYRQAARVSPQWVDPVFNLAALAWSRKDWPKVIEAYEEVLRRDPQNPKAQAFLEKARQQRGT